MVQMAFNTANYQPNVGGTSQVLPSGKYIVHIVESNLKTTSTGNGQMLIFKTKVLSEECQGYAFTIRLNIQNPSSTAVEIAMGELTAISLVCGVAQWQDTQQLHGQPFMIEVIEKPRNDEPTKMSNEVVGYYDVNGNAPTPQAAQAPAAPQSPPVAPSAPPVQPVAQPSVQAPVQAVAAAPVAVPVQAAGMAAPIQNAAAPMQQPDPVQQQVDPAVFAQQQALAAASQAGQPAPFATGAPTPVAPTGGAPWEQ